MTDNERLAQLRVAVILDQLLLGDLAPAGERVAAITSDRLGVAACICLFDMLLSSVP